MSESAGRAVFLSYASQDAEAARRICEALRAAGVHVWFDQSELRGGDAWDQKIRGQIKECALFVPIISGNTQARAEGYFRREWKLAVDRTHDMADHVAFLLPVVIDDTSDTKAYVPEKFREVQWTRVLSAYAEVAFAARVATLLNGAPPAVPSRVGAAPRAPAEAMTTPLAGGGALPSAPPKPRRAKPVTIAVAALLVLVVAVAVLPMPRRVPPNAFRAWISLRLAEGSAPAGSCAIRTGP